MEENNSQPDLEQLKKQNEEYLLGWKRAMADYQNLKKQMERAAADSLKYGAQTVILSFLPSLDHFREAMAHIPKEDMEKGWVSGVLLIKKELEELLKQFGVEEMKCVGEQFDPNLHEAAGSEDGGESGTILKEIQAGYKYQNEILRSAKVIISK
ncbi:nucleotide exchange factor GrpE [Candidatus Uhrbacteria bacterium]|nr:nucleotide exchange factor GrpE [Candidatus Uhrbacteria bacterium]